MSKISTRMKLITLVGATLLILGIVGVTPTLYYDWSNKGSVVAHGLPTVSVASSNTETKTTVVSGHPVAIAIPSLNINLPVIDGFYNHNNGEWTLTLNKAQFATPSVEPNSDKGLTFIYGHYRREVFAYLHLIKPGSDAIITTANGYKFTYRYTGTYATAPSDTSLLTYQGPPVLMVQTCSGAWFQNRQMYQFSLVSYQKI